MFDCRFLPNPGREEKYQTLTGQDQAVLEYLQARPGVEHFLQWVFAIVDAAIANYQERQFSQLMVSFGCTGGQHRSVYCANRLRDHLRSSNIHIELHHTELENPNP